ncbi:PH domain-containing protein [Pseudoclavibacter chungangensis]|uniref:PH domain-containing protein n=1 Tax=Pseudoclavibacter chungangensis TaxID=587635 RepID=A0A7J5BQS7_9MICO|nr:PH domain-containing protein [Pseudoclavibacter chungangensis]KAB1653641.1 PH domain-containing protein [Pseudoclavibacter chungangensis]NYJ68755.1 membrane protein YdbS with pleckstrin-like domain [Pseudoclavibacter chungangensis]
MSDGTGAGDATAPRRPDGGEPGFEVRAASRRGPDSRPGGGTAPSGGTFGDDGAWQRVSRKYVIVELVPALVLSAVLAAAVAFLIAIDVPWGAAIAGFALFWCLLGAVLAVPTARAIGYRLRDDDLVFRRGLVWRSEVAVPYGRMQLVDIRQGPLERVLGLASLRLVTAAPAGTVVVVGFTREQIESLRAGLVELAESRRAGL